MTRYELLDRIGVGGMAEIFRGKAVAAGGFEKPVAIKRILPHLSQDQRFVELLIAEAKVLSLLKHRNITQIFDVGLGDDQQYFLVMEYVDGKDLGAIVRALEARRKKIPFDLALHIVAEICEALEHAHSARAPDGKAMGLVHRDISPSNVLLSRAGEVKLTDFGIAKRAEQEQTRGGAVKGKFAYISPEQARNEHLDPRSDVFSVGILLWELTTNRALFSKLADMEALRGVREPAKIPPPSAVDPTLSRELDALVMAALAPEAARRPTAGMLGAKIRSLRYSLEETVGDPATELAKLIEAAEQEARKSVQIQALQGDGSLLGHVTGLSQIIGFEDGGENTVIRIRTADAFSMRDQDGTGMAQARMVIDRFEEEETRLAQLSSDQLRLLRAGAPKDSGPQRPVLPKGAGAPRAKRPTDSDEPTTARAPLSRQMLMDDGGEEATFAASPQAVHAMERDAQAPRSLDSDEHTRLVAPRDRRTPVPAPRAVRQPTASVPPPMPPMPAQPQPQPQPPIEALAAPLPNAGAWQAQPMQPAYQTPLPYGYPPPQPAWSGVVPTNPPRAASPTMQDAFGNPVYGHGAAAMGAGPPLRQSMPQVAGFGTPKKQGLKPWMLVVGALIVAALAFVITRGLIGGHVETPAKPAATTK